MTMYVAAMPNVIAHDGAAASRFCKSEQGRGLNTARSVFGFGSGQGSNASMLQCQLYSSTYRTSFAFQNGEQNVSTTLIRKDSERAAHISNLVTSERLISGLYGKNITSANLDQARAQLAQLSYQAMFQAFTSLITGKITVNSGTHELTDSTNIQSIGLLNTKELFYLTTYLRHKYSSCGAPDLQGALSWYSDPNVSSLSGMSRMHQSAPDLSLQDALETMFENFTLSLMSSSALW